MIYIVMGVSGCGKSTLGAFLSEKLGWRLHEGDSFHPQENVDKMANGIPLTDQDRYPWLLNLHKVIQRERNSGRDAVIACSALKRQYRQILLHGAEALAASSSSSSSSSPSSCPDQSASPCTSADVFFLFLHGDYDLIKQRLESRTGHYMKADLLRSQFDTLQPPLVGEENVLPLDIGRSLSDMATEVEEHLSRTARNTAGQG